jgi:hypothetical protein
MNVAVTEKFCLGHSQRCDVVRQARLSRSFKGMTDSAILDCITDVTAKQGGGNVVTLTKGSHALKMFVH